MQGGVGAPGHDIQVVRGIVLLDLILVVTNHAWTSRHDGHVFVGFSISHRSYSCLRVNGWLNLHECFNVFLSAELGIRAVVFTRVSSFAFTGIAPSTFGKFSPAPLDFDGTQQLSI